MPVYNNVTELIGKTPLLRINNLTGANDGTVLMKLERCNPGGSVKDRIAYSMIKSRGRRPAETWWYLDRAYQWQYRNWIGHGSSCPGL